MRDILLLTKPLTPSSLLLSCFLLLDLLTDAVDACVNGTAANATSVDCVKLQDPYLAVVGVMCAVISCIGSTIALLIILAFCACLHFCLKNMPTNG